MPRWVVHHMVLAEGAGEGALVRTYSARTPPTGQFGRVQVFDHQGVALGAMGFPAVNPTGTVAAPHVGLGGHRLEVVGTDTMPHPTEVVQLEANRDWAKSVFITPAMSEDVATLTTIFKPPITGPLNAGNPQPAPTNIWAKLGDRAILIDLDPEADSDGWTRVDSASHNLCSFKAGGTVRGVSAFTALGRLVT